MLRKANSQNGICARVTACALLCFIIYGATFEIVHQHGNVTRRNSSAFSADTFSCTDADFSNDNSTQNFQCLICQMHRNLADGLICAPLAATSIIVRSPSVTHATITHFNQPSIPSRGRAPPVNSLS